MFASCSRSSLKAASRKVITVSQNQGVEYFKALSSTKRCASSAASPQNTPSSSTLKYMPWSFPQENNYETKQHRIALARYQNEMIWLARKGSFVKCLRLCAAMKQDNVMPDLLVYNALLSAAVPEGAHEEAWAILEDMVAMGIQPDRQSFHHVMNASGGHTSQIWRVLDTMAEMKIEPNERTFAVIALHFVDQKNIEMALQYLHEMGRRGFLLQIDVAQAVIKLAAELSFARLAIDVAESFEQDSIRKLDAEVWQACLISSAETLYVDGVQRCWDRLVRQLNILPDEGLCIHVLHTAARHALPSLGMDVIRALTTLKVEWQEYHFSPLIEAFARAGQLKEAFGVLDIMRSNGINPGTETTFPIFEAIKGDIDVVDSMWSILDDLRAEGKAIDPMAINVIIEAAVHLGDLQSAVGAYKSFADYGTTPTVETFNLLLSGCIAAKHRQLGDKLLLDMKKVSIAPDKRTYERIILLSLTQPQYEDAFFYLEEMKAQGFVPPISVYDSIIRTCVESGDTRYSLAFKEMNECGYQPSRTLTRMVDSLSQREVLDENPQLVTT